MLKMGDSSVVGEYIKVRGKYLYIEDFGKQNEDTLLYLHGGPGASCLDFSFFQAKALAESIRVVAFDQRGVLRSEPLNNHEPFGVNDIIEDCESIRIALGIQTWTVLGHSFGGYLAAIYASKNPNVVDKIIYEAPCFDLGLSVKSMFKAAITTLKRIEKEELIPEFEAYIQGDWIVSELIGKWSSFCSRIGEYNKDLIYLHRVNPEYLNHIYNQDGIEDEMWKRSQLHTTKLFEEGLIMESILDILPSLKQESLVLHGKYDPVFCTYQKDKFMELENGKVIFFNDSAHFPRIEEPLKYLKEVLSFINEIKQ